MLRTLAFFGCLVLATRLFIIDSPQTDDIIWAIVGAFVAGQILHSVLNPIESDIELLKELDEDEHRGTRQD